MVHWIKSAMQIKNLFMLLPNKCNFYNFFWAFASHLSQFSFYFFNFFFSLRPTLSYLIAQNGPQKWGPTTFCVIYLAYGRIRVLSLFLLLLSSLSGFNDEDDEARKYFKTILCKCFPCSCFKRVAIAGDKRQKKGKRRPPQQRMGPNSCF